METLASDMASMMSSKKSSQSILDIVGADMNTTYDRAMQIQMVSDTFHISSGGQTFGENYNIQIQLRDDNAIHYLKRSGLVFDFISDAASFPHNAAALFSGLEISFGNVTLSTPFQHYYIQQKMTKLSQKAMEKDGNGLCLINKDVNYPHAWRVAGGALEPYPVVMTHGGAANPMVYAGVASALSNEYNAVHRVLADHFFQRVEATSVAGQLRVKMFVPFQYLFDCINVLPDSGAVFTGYGQSIKMNLRTNIARDCLAVVQAGGAMPTYSITNMQLLKVFSKIDSPRADLVLKSSITLPLCKFVHWQQQVTTPVINAIYSVSKDDLITGLIFAFHTNTRADQTGEATNIIANLTNAAPSQFKSPLTYFPQLPIQQIDLHIGGEPVIINAQQIQCLHILESFGGGESATYQNPVLRSIKYAYKIDLRRFTEDLYGSSAKQTTTVQIQISLRQGGGSRTLYQQGLDWNAVGSEFSNFSFYSYLECLNFMELKNGVYQSK